MNIIQTYLSQTNTINEVKAYQENIDLDFEIEDIYLVN